MILFPGGAYTYLDIGLRLIRHLHEEFRLTINHVLQNALVDTMKLSVEP